MRDRIRISGATPHIDQQRFTEDRHKITNIGGTRIAVGAFFEEASRLLFNGTRHQIDATKDYCPDLSLPDRVFVEVKAIGNSRQAIIFEKRLKRDRKFRRDENVLFYAFWVHHAPTTKYQWREDLHLALAHATDYLLIIPAARLNGFLRGKKPTGVLMDNGRLRDRFHRIAMGDLMRLTGAKKSGHEFEIPAPAPFGIQMPPLTVYGTSAEHVIQLTTLEISKAGELLHELSTQRLEVKLARAPRPQFIGHRIRVVTNHNPQWYRDMVNEAPPLRKSQRRGRKADSAGHRDRTMRALERLAEGRCDTRLCWRMRSMVRRLAGLPPIGH